MENSGRWSTLSIETVVFPLAIFANASLAFALNSLDVSLGSEIEFCNNIFNCGLVRIGAVAVLLSGGAMLNDWSAGCVGSPFLPLFVFCCLPLDLFLDLDCLPPMCKKGDLFLDL